MCDPDLHSSVTIKDSAMLRHYCHSSLTFIPSQFLFHHNVSQMWRSRGESPYRFLLAPCCGPRNSPTLIFTVSHAPQPVHPGFLAPGVSLRWLPPNRYLLVSSRENSCYCKNYLTLLNSMTLNEVCITEEFSLGL